MGEIVAYRVVFERMVYVPADSTQGRAWIEEHPDAPLIPEDELPTEGVENVD